MTGHRPWRELVEETFTPEQLRRMDELAPGRREVDRLVNEAYDEATERMVGRRQDPPRVTFEDLTADFTSDQWAELERLVNELLDEKGVHELAAAADVEIPPLERSNTWTDDAPFTLVAYTEGVREGWPESDIERWIVCGLPRDFNVLNAAQQRAALAERVPLTHTRWDALLAAMVEHVAWLHGHERPAWVDEPERFLDSTWVLSPIPIIRMHSLMYAPAAFLRHGAIPDPRDLDSRGGERYEWTP